MLNTDVSRLAVKSWNGLVSCICIVLCLGLNKLKYEHPLLLFQSLNNIYLCVIILVCIFAVGNTGKG